MADIDTLRQALRDDRSSPCQGIDVDLVMTRGRRLRRRRRLAVAAVVACLAGAVAGTAVGITHQASPVGPAPAPAQHRASTGSHTSTPVPRVSTSSPGLPGTPTPTAS